MKKIHTAMLDVMEQVQAIEKNQRNQAQKFNFRGIDDVYNALHGLLAKAGVFSVPWVMSSHREERTSKSGAPVFSTVLRIKYTFYADDGSYVECVVDGEGMDYGDKSTSKAMAIAHKYALLQVFAIPTAEEKDPDFDSYETTNKIEEVEQKAAAERKSVRAEAFKVMKARMDETGITEQHLLEHLGLKEKKELSTLSTEKLIQLTADKELFKTT